MHNAYWMNGSGTITIFVISNLKVEELLSSKIIKQLQTI